jgi:hypothetical protein
MKITFVGVAKAKKEKGMRKETCLNSITICAVVVLFVMCYARAGTWQTLDFEGTTQTQLLAIDGSNIIAETGGVNYYLYNGTTWSSLPDMPGHYDTKPYDISGGVIAGTYFNPGVHGYTYNGSIWTTYDEPLATNATEILSIDGSNLVGDYWDDVGIHGFFYNGTTWTSLDYAGANYTKVYGIRGENLVGGYGPDTGLGHGFLYNYKEMTWTALDFPGGVSFSTYIKDIDGGNIVGCYSYFGFHGFLYNGTTWTTLDFPGANYTQIEGISGNNIVGWYNDSSGTHGFVYIIPEPATLLLLGFGAAMVARKR